jgi:thiol-disulfide isomerase/thioredoxin
LFQAQTQEIPVYKTYEEFEADILNIDDDKIYVINFWATWCGPCVKELPYFEGLAEEYGGKEVVTLLVSIDWATNLDRKLKPFIEKKGLKKKVILFDDPKPNNWIDKIDSSWSGAIPITLVMSKDNKDFYEKEYHSTDEIVEDIQAFINKY